MPETPGTVLRVALPVPLPRLFDYLPPAGQAADAGWIGTRVRVPFGRGDGEMVGVVADLGPTEDPSRLKQLLARLDAAPVLDGELFASLRWAADYYHAPLGDMLATALPVPLRAGQLLPETARHGWRLTPEGVEQARAPGRDGRPRRLLLQLAEALHNMVQVAKSGRVSPEDMQGGTFTITNVGVFGVDGGTPILNLGESAIMCLGTIARRPWVIGKGPDEQIVIRSVCTLSLTFDHRLVDGELASKFLSDVADILADPGLAMMF